MKNKTLTFLFLILIALIACNEDEDPVKSCMPIEFDPSFSHTSSNILIGGKVSFTNENDAFQTFWEFEGGIPSYSVQQNPTILYPDAGTFSVTLSYISECDTITKTLTDLIEVIRDTLPANDFDTTFIDSKYRKIEGQYGTLGDPYNRFWFYENIYDTASIKPLILIYGGGGFRYGSDLHSLQPLALSLVDKGYKVATLKTYFKNYEVSPTQNQRTYRMIRANHSVKAGIRFFNKYHTEYFIDATRIVSGGYSSGAIAALMSSYFGQDILTEQILSHYGVSGGFEGDQGHLGYSSTPAACFAIAGQISSYANGDLNALLMVGKPALFGVCAQADTEVNCNISVSDEFLGFGANSYVDSARVYGMCAEKYIFTGGNHHSGIENYHRYIDQLDDFLTDVFENQCTGYLDNQ